jgi:hypothetical protein
MHLVEVHNILLIWILLYCIELVMIQFYVVICVLGKLLLLRLQMVLGLCH